MRHFGLIGYPLSHSFSKKYFSKKFKNENLTDAEYNLYPLESIDEFLNLTQQINLTGLNVTIPYKEKVIPYLDEIEEEAKSIGAVNTIKFSNKKTIGYNTDAFGFEQSLLPLLKKQHTKALILGTGGASKAVVYVLNKLGISTQYVSRNSSANCIAYRELTDEIMNQYKLIVNCTPLGMYPEIEKKPDIPYQMINSEYLLYDLIYNPEESAFLKEGRMRGAQTKNGLEMLYLQAQRSWEIWNKE